MKSYMDLAKKQFKVSKKKSFLSILGILLGIMLFTFIMVFFKFQNLNKIEQYKSNYGNYEVSYSISESSKEKLDILDKSTIVKNYSIIQEKEEKVVIDNKEMNVKLYNLDKNAFNNTFNISIKYSGFEGGIPFNEKEIVLDSIFKSQNIKIGENIKVGDKEYKVVGFFKNENSNKDNLKAISYYKYNSKDNIRVFVNINSNKDVISNINKLTENLGFKSEIVSNKILKSTNKVIYGNYLIDSIYNVDSAGAGILGSDRIIHNIIIFLIMVTSVVISYGLINFSMTEKIKEFGILRCIGASPKQIKNLVYKEIIIISLVAIIPAIIIGYLIAYILINIFIAKGIYIAYNLRVGIYPIIILKVLFISFITIILAAFTPARRASKISPMEGIRSGKKDDIKIKKRRSKFIRKIFGIEGEIAYRNLRAKPIIFWSTTITLILCFITSIFFSTYIMAIIEAGGTVYKGSGKEIKLNILNNPGGVNSEFDDISKYNEKLFYDGQKDLKDIKDYLNKSNLIKSDILYTSSIPGYMKLFIEKDGIKYNERFKNSLSNEFNSFYEYKSSKGKDGVISDDSIYVYDSASFNTIKNKIKGDDKNLKDFNENGVIIVDAVAKDKTYNAFIDSIINVKAGDKLNITFARDSENIPLYNMPISNLENKLKDKNKSFEMKVIGTINPVDLIEGGEVSESKLSIIISKDFLDRNKDDIIGKFEGSGTYSQNLYFDLDNKLDRNNVIEKITDSLSSKYQINLYDNFKEIESLRTIVKVFSIGFYGLLGIVIFIMISSIIINKSMNINSRKREFGTMLAIGMERSRLKRVVLFESILQCIMVLIIGLPIAIKISNLLLASLVVQGEIYTVNVNIVLVIIVILVTFIVTLLTSIIPFRRFKKFDMIDMMKEEE